MYRYKFLVTRASVAINLVVKVNILINIILKIKHYSNLINLYNPKGLNSLQSQLPICSPTVMPTSLPTISISTNDNIIIIACSVTGGALLISMLIAYFYFSKKKRSKKEKERQEKEILSKLPIHLFLLTYLNEGFETKAFNFFFNDEGHMTETNDNNDIVIPIVNVTMSSKYTTSRKVFKSILEQNMDTISQLDHNKRTVIDLLLELYGDDTRKDKEFLLQLILIVLRKWF